jgi:hypothetical protein
MKTSSNPWRVRDRFLASPEQSKQAKDIAEAVVSTTMQWPPSDLPALTVCFWPPPPAANGQKVSEDHDDATIDDLMTVTARWTKDANVDFNYKESGSIRRCQDATSAKIRVTLHVLDRSYYDRDDPIELDWSRYGHASTQTHARVTVSLVNALRNYLSHQDISYHFFVSHEMGHALGLLHEHQRINCSSFLKDDNAIKQAYHFQSDADVKIFKNNMQQLPDSGRDSQPITKFDVDSVMLYNFPREIWRDLKPGEVNPCARAQDVEFPDDDDLRAVISMYGPKPKSPPIALPSSPPSRSTPGASAIGPEPAATTAQEAVPSSTTPLPPSPPAGSSISPAAAASDRTSQIEILQQEVEGQLQALRNTLEIEVAKRSGCRPSRRAAAGADDGLCGLYAWLE